MEIFARPDPILMGRVLPNPIRNRIGYGFFLLKKKKNQKWVRVRSGPGFIKKSDSKPSLNPDLGLGNYEITKKPLYIYIERERERAITNPKSLIF